MKASENKQSKKDSDIHQDIRHLGVLIERVDDNVKLVAEQYGDIKKTLDSHTKILDNHTKMFDKITVILNSHTKLSY